MLPYTPLHHLLLARARPAVRADQRERLRRADRLPRRRRAGAARRHRRRVPHPRPADPHPRPTTRWCGSSAGARAAAAPLPRVRARAAARCRWPSPRPVLACGAELKNTFCLAEGGHAFVSHHIGDLENYETLRVLHRGHRALPAAVRHRARGGRARPAPGVPVHQVRPGRWTACELVGVQHHHAHIASCLADNGEPGPVIGVAFDGLGLRHRRHASGAASSCVADLAGLRAGRAPGAGADARRRGGDPAAVADGRGLPGRRSTAGPDGLDVVRRNADRWDAVVGLARARHELAADLQRGPAVRRGRGAARRPRHASTTRARPRSSWSSSPTRASAAPTRSRVDDGDALLRSPAPTWSARSSTTWRPGSRRPVIAARFHNGARRRHRRRAAHALRERHRPGDGRPVRRGLPEPAAAGADGRRAGAPRASGCSPTAACPPTTAASAWPGRGGGRPRPGEPVPGRQQMRGSGSPTSRSTIRVPPNAVRSSTSPGGSSLTRPMTAAPSPSGWRAQRGQGRVGRGRRATTATSRPSQATYSGSMPSSSRRPARPRAAPGRRPRRPPRRPRRASATSLRMVATPPRVASRSSRTPSAPASSRSADQPVQRGGVGDDVGLDVQLAAGQHDR